MPVEFLTFAKLAEKAPIVDGKPIQPTTLRRWALEGIGEVKLYSRIIGGRRVSSERALQDFLRRCEETANHV